MQGPQQHIKWTATYPRAKLTATDKKKVLTRALRQIQAAAKKKYQFTNPEELLGADIQPSVRSRLSNSASNPRSVPLHRRSKGARLT